MKPEGASGYDSARTRLRWLVESSYRWLANILLQDICAAPYHLKFLTHILIYFYKLSFDRNASFPGVPLKAGNFCQSSRYAIAPVIGTPGTSHACTMFRILLGVDLESNPQSQSELPPRRLFKWRTSMSKLLRSTSKTQRKVVVMPARFTMVPNFGYMTHYFCIALWPIFLYIITLVNA